MFLPDVMIHMSPLRGATHATGVLISPVPNWIVGPYGSRDCASSCGTAASASTTPAIHATPGRIVRIGPPKLGVITVPLQDARRRAGSRNRGDGGPPATMATAPYAAYDRDGEHCGRCKRHALHRSVQLSAQMASPALAATRRKPVNPSSCCCCNSRGHAPIPIVGYGAEGAQQPIIRVACTRPRSARPPETSVMLHLHRTLAATALFLATATVAAGQDPRTTAADSLLNVALSQARAGDTSKAIKTLERASRIAPRYAP